MANDADQIADRLEQILDGALAAFQSGDEDGALMALEEALKIVDTLPKQIPDVIFLPDQSRRAP